MPDNLATCSAPTNASYSHHYPPSSPLSSWILQCMQCMLKQGVNLLGLVAHTNDNIWEVEARDGIQGYTPSFETSLGFERPRLTNNNNNFKVITINNSEKNKT